MIPGPRVYPSGPMISQTSGHSDNRPPEEPEYKIYLEKIHMLAVADGVPDVMTAARQNLRMGATRIKIAAGGGVSSNYDPLDVTEYTFEEIKAAVDVTKTWNTYVAVHVNTDAGVRQALAAGAPSIEHGFPMSEDTLKLMAEKGAWISMQLLMRRPEIGGFISVAPPANLFDFTFLAPCPASGLIVHGDNDDVVPQEAVQKLVDKLKHQKDIQIQFKVASGANHFFADQMDQLGEIVTEYLTQRMSPEKQQKPAKVSAR